MSRDLAILRPLRAQERPREQEELARSSILSMAWKRIQRITLALGTLELQEVWVPTLGWRQTRIRKTTLFSGRFSIRRATREMRLHMVQLLMQPETKAFTMLTALTALVVVALPQLEHRKWTTVISKLVHCGL